LSEAAEAHYRRGIELQDAGNLAEACDSYRAATADDAGHAKAHNNLGVLLQARGDLAGAVASYERALGADPALAPAIRNLAGAWLEQSDAARAQRLVKDALVRYPRDAQLHFLHGNVLRAMGQHARAASAYRSALALEPQLQGAQLNLGLALAQKDGQEGEAYFRGLLELQPHSAAPLIYLGGLYLDAGKLDLAIDCNRRAIALEPDMAQAHFNYALTLLLNEDYEKGLDEYEWRWGLPELAGLVPSFPRPAWHGGSLQGKTILLYAEQGLGDIIQFARYIPMVATSAERVLVSCPRTMMNLLQRSFPGVTVCSDAESPPNYDVHSALMSLPRIFRTRPDTIPHAVPYLHADAEAALRRGGELDSGRLKVGLCWGIDSRGGPRKSMRLRALEALGRVQGISFYSLQRGSFARDVAEPPPGMNLTEPADLRDFSETAALIANLDLVISVDTAVAHLAGAMAKPAWTLVPFPPDWRWRREGEESPWYPSMRLFRQTRPGEWESAVANVSSALAKLAAKRVG
jgi:tetratricopeptide (TPR) repeat protein